MRRRINLRQIEVFKAVIERGTVSAAAATLNVSQPALSKSLAQLEADSELQLFERVRGRLAPTEQGMGLYQEIDRIFSGVQQVENAIDALHRQAQGRVLIGVMPGLSGAFVQQVVSAFLREHPGTYCSIEVRNSEWIVESLVRRRLDIGFVNHRMQNPFLATEMLGVDAIVCIMPSRHKLASKRLIVPADLENLPYISFGPETDIGHLLSGVLTIHGINPAVEIVTNVAPTVCEFVACGAGVSLVHPLMVSSLDRIVMRRFEPQTTLGFLMASPRSSRNARLIEELIRIAKATSDAMISKASFDP